MVKTLFQAPYKIFKRPLKSSGTMRESWSENNLKRESKNSGCVFVFCSHQAAHKRCLCVNSNTLVYEYFHIISRDLRVKLTTLYKIKASRWSHNVLLRPCGAQKSCSCPNTASTRRCWRVVGAWLGVRNLRLLSEFVFTTTLSDSTTRLQWPLENFVWDLEKCFDHVTSFSDFRLSNGTKLMVVARLEKIWHAFLKKRPPHLPFQSYFSTSIKTHTFW